MKRKDGEVVEYWSDYILEAKNKGLKFLSWNVWSKGNQISLANQCAMFAINHEWIFIFGEKRDLNRTIPNKLAGEKNHKHGGGQHQRQRDGSVQNGSSFDIKDHKQLYTVLDCGTDKSLGIDHPAKFPVALPEEYINACSNVRDTVYEPFTGSGSTLIACEKTKRKCHGMEIDPHYCDVIIQRWEKFTSKEAVLESTGESYNSIKGNTEMPARCT